MSRNSTFTTTQEDCRTIAKVIRENTDVKGVHSNVIFSGLNNSNNTYKVAYREHLLVEASIPGYYRATKAVTNDLVGVIQADATSKQKLTNERNRLRKNATVTSQIIDGETVNVINIPENVFSKR